MWWDTLPENLRTPELIEVYKAYDSLGAYMAKTHETLNTTRASLAEKEAAMKSLIKVPGENATQEEINQFFKGIGVPESEKDYGIDEEVGKMFKSANLTKTQAKKLAEILGENTKTKQQASEQARLNKIKEYETSLGDKKEATYTLAKKAIAHFYGEKAAEKEPIILQDPELIDVNARIGKIISEKPGLFQSGYTGAGQGGLYKTMEGLD